MVTLALRGDEVCALTHALEHYLNASHFRAGSLGEFKEFKVGSESDRASLRRICDALVKAADDA